MHAGSSGGSEASRVLPLQAAVCPRLHSPPKNTEAHKRIDTAPSLNLGRGGQALLGHSLFPGVTGSASYSCSGDGATVLFKTQPQEECVREPRVLSGDLGQWAMPEHMFGYTARMRRFCPQTKSLSLPEGLLQA